MKKPINTIDWAHSYKPTKYYKTSLETVIHVFLGIVFVLILAWIIIVLTREPSKEEIKVQKDNDSGDETEYEVYDEYDD